MGGWGWSAADQQDRQQARAWMSSHLVGDDQHRTSLIRDERTWDSGVRTREDLRDGTEESEVHVGLRALMCDRSA